MRQVSIRTLKSKLSQELIDLPVEVTKNGKVVAMIVKPIVTTRHGKTLKCGHNELKGESSLPYYDIIGVHRIGAVKDKLTEIIKKKKGADKSETDIPTDGRPTFGYPKSYQARKRNNERSKEKFPMP